MAVITGPEAEDVYLASKLTPDHFESVSGTEYDDDDITDMIEADILPDIVAEVNMAVDEAALPYDYPFSSGAMAAAFPTRSGAANQEWISASQGRFKRVIMWRALAELFVRVASLDGRYDEKAEMYKRWADDAMRDALESLRKVVKALSGLEVNSAEDEIGIAVINYWPSRITGI